MGCERLQRFVITPQRRQQRGFDEPGVGQVAGAVGQNRLERLQGSFESSLTLVA